MKRRNPFGSRATRLLAYENARPSESRCRPLTGRHARTPPSAFPFLHITMSKSRRERGKLPPPEPPMEANPPSGVNDSRSAPRRTQALLRFYPRIARSRTVPQEVGTTRAKDLFKQRSPACQGPGNRCPVFSLFRLIVTLGPHSCPNAPPLSVSLTAR